MDASEGQQPINPYNDLVQRNMDLTRKIDKLQTLGSIYLKTCEDQGNDLLKCNEQIKQQELEIETLKRMNGSVVQSVEPGPGVELKEAKKANKALVREVKELKLEIGDLKNTITRIQTDLEFAGEQLEKEKKISKKFQNDSIARNTEKNSAVKRANSMAEDIKNLQAKGGDRMAKEQIESLESKVLSRDFDINQLKAAAKTTSARLSYTTGLANEFRSALFSMRADYKAATGGCEPPTAIPDEDAEPDSGGEYHDDINGRKRGRVRK